MSKTKMFGKIIAVVMTAALSVTVVPVNVAVSDAAAKPALSKTKLNMKAGTKTTLKVTGSRIKSVTWKSTKASIAAVKKKNAKAATVTAKSKGAAVVKATVKYAANKKKVLSCKVTVKPVNNGSDVPNPTATQPASDTGSAATATPVADLGTPAGPTAGNQEAPTNLPTEKPEPTEIPELDENNLTVADYPTMFADAPDCDFIRVDGAYYMVSTTMNMVPGAPIMKSTDLVHWRIVNYAHNVLADDDRSNLENGEHVYGNGSWAAALKYSEDEGLYYVCFNTNQNGFYLYTTDDLENGEWKMHHYRRGYHDPSMLIENGSVYIVSAGGSSENKCILQEMRLDDDNELLEPVGEEIKLFDKPEGWGLWEGCHIYHIGEYYYVMIIGTWNADGWYRSETCYRTKDLFSGEWEEQQIFKGSTNESGSGIAQGGIADTLYGDWYGILFQDHDAVGRVPSVLAVNWDYTDDNGKNYKDWPIMGYYDESGKFVACLNKEKVQLPIKIRLNKSDEESYIVGDDDFDYSEGESMKLVWQWNHNPDNDNWSVTDNPGHYRITNGRTCNNIWFARNSLTQRTVGPVFTSEAVMIPSNMKDGDYAGLVAVASEYGMVGVTCQDGELRIFQGSGAAGGKKASVNDKIKVNETAGDVISKDTKVYLKIEYKFTTGSTRADKARFYYSLDGSSWNSIGEELSMSFDTNTTFMGARTWLSSYATNEKGGYVDFDSYKCYQD